jgi:hypothetical protein
VWLVGLFVGPGVACRSGCGLSVQVLVYRSGCGLSVRVWLVGPGVACRSGCGLSVWPTEVSNRGTLPNILPAINMHSQYHDFDSSHKTENNEWIAFTANNIGKRFQASGGKAPKWVALLLDGIHARSMTTLHRRVGVDQENIVIVEHDQESFDTLKTNHPDCTVVYNHMQQYVRAEAFPDDEFNIVFFDWMCTIQGNGKEGPPLDALSDYLNKTRLPFVVVGQTFCLRGRKIGDRVHPYQKEKDLVCGEITKRATCAGYLPLWNSYFESLYTREGGRTAMFFCCVVLAQIPSQRSPQYLWDFFNLNQLQIRNK